LTCKRGFVSASCKSNSYDYVCVSRSDLKKYKEVSTDPVRVKDNRGREIELREVEIENGDSEYYLKETSSLKSLKESAMNNQFIKRIEDELNKIASGIHKKGCTKKYGKICERIGRLKAEYAATTKLFSIEIEKDANDICTAVGWKLNPEAVVEKQQEHGVYFLKTSLKKGANASRQESLTWNIYNCIRNIESSIRILKTDLDLRPVYHKTDEACEAHLHLGLLAYWLVNTVRHKLKQHHIHSDWREIVRVMNTQKVVTTCVENDKKQRIRVRKGSEPADKVKLFYSALGYKPAPFIRKKSVVNKNEFMEKRRIDLLNFNSS
jgi:hypothetical protein